MQKAGIFDVGVSAVEFKIWKQINETVAMIQSGFLESWEGEPATREEVSLVELYGKCPPYLVPAFLPTCSRITQRMGGMCMGTRGDFAQDDRNV